MNSKKLSKYNILDEDYRKFKQSIMKLSSFPDQDEASRYYNSQLSLLLSISGRSLDQLLAERAVSQNPSEAALIAQDLLEKIEKSQGF